MRLVVDQPGALNERHEALLRYAAVFSKLNLFRTPTGEDIDLSGEVEDLRRWFNDTLVPLMPAGKPADIAGLRAQTTSLSQRLETTRKALLTHHAQDFGPEHLDEEICNKKLVLALGGGGGAGLTHLGTFALFNEMGVVPELIAGSSMGSIMGALRALDRSYDPVATALALPKDLNYNTVFRPFSGYSRFGFPGAFHMNLLKVAREIFKRLTGSPTLNFNDLPIKLQVVVTGIRTGFHLDEREFLGDGKDFSSLSIRSKLKQFFRVIRQISANPRFLSQIVFGKEPGTEAFSVVEAVGFSCAVPGLLHYDIYHDDPNIIDPLERLFEQQQLLRMCDGGVVNNVPSQVVWDSVQQGAIGTRNAFIMSCDVFAPISSGRNLLWIPIQQIARQNVLANKPYSDYHKTFNDPPSPLQVIVNQYSRLKTIILAARKELSADEPYLRRALRPLPSYGIWLETKARP